MQRKTQTPEPDNLPSTLNQPVSSYITWGKSTSLGRLFPICEVGVIIALTSEAGWERT